MPASSDSSAITFPVFRTAIEVEAWLRALVPASPFAGQVYAVGGSVRDALLGVLTKDLDLVVEREGGARAFCEYLHARFPEFVSRPHALGQGYPIWQVVLRASGLAPKEGASRDRSVTGARGRAADAEAASGGAEGRADSGAGVKAGKVATSTMEAHSDAGVGGVNVDPGLTDTLAGAVCFELQVADTQREMFPDPASRQRISVFGDLAEDCARRDFTVNMLYRDLTTGALVDPCGRGEADLRAGVLRGHPAVDLTKIFADDPLRMLRLVRFEARLGWAVPEDVLATARALAPRLAILSGERVRDEMSKILVTDRVPAAWERLRTLGFLDVLFPEFLPMIGCGQDRIYHSEGDVWVHTLLVVRQAPRELMLQWAAILHDTGKPATRSEVGPRVKFLGHERTSEDIARAVLTRLRYGKAFIEEVALLVRLHLRGGDVESWTSLKPARKLLRDAGEAIEPLLRLIEADSRSSLDESGQPRLAHLPLLRDALAKAAEIPLRRQPVVTGHDVMTVCGIAPGPGVRALLNRVEELEDELASHGETLTRERALAALREWTE
jgi:tRNA nucleotidyltransferase/poly(A) polymerase